MFFNIYNQFYTLAICKFVVSQQMIDKAANHLVSRHILMPALCGCLIETNVASRPKKGTGKALEYYEKYRKICNAKYKKYYVLT